MAPRLKVFSTSDGLTDYVVATSSRPKALAAWGVRQDLFKEGRARETDDPGLVKAALERPGEVLRRPAGTRAALAAAQPARKAKPAGPSKAALRKVEALERRLEALDAAQARAREDLETERARLEEKAARLEADHRTARTRLEDELGKARKGLDSRFSESKPAPE